MTHSYTNGVLTITNTDGGTLSYPYNPETQVPFSSEQEALDYAYSRPMYFIPKPTLDELKHRATQKVIEASTAKSPVTINTVTYNGGDGSASAISGAVTLAQSLQDTDVKLWDINNTIKSYTFEEAQIIAAQIAKAYRDAKYSDYQKIEAINACETIEELEAL